MLGRIFVGGRRGFGEGAACGANVVVVIDGLAAFGTDGGIGGGGIDFVRLMGFDASNARVDENCRDEWDERHEESNAGSCLKRVSNQDESDDAGEDHEYAEGGYRMTVTGRSVGWTPFDEFGAGDEVGGADEASAAFTAVRAEFEIGMGALRTYDEVRFALVYPLIF